jgi:hypothetical protein
MLGMIIYHIHGYHGLSGPVSKTHAQKRGSASRIVLLGNYSSNLEFSPLNPQPDWCTPSLLLQISSFLGEKLSGSSILIWVWINTY